MGSVGSDAGKTKSTDNKFHKLPPKKIFVGRNNPVDHSSVPRRLRSSAVRKGVYKSASPPQFNQKKRLPSIVNGHKSRDRLCGKRSKLNRKNGISEPMTKDEEEVAEALHALAALIPGGNGNSLKNNQPQELSKEPGDSDPLSLVMVAREESEVSPLPSSDNLAITPPAVVGGSSEENSPLTHHAFLTRCKTSEIRQFNLNENSSLPLNLFSFYLGTKSDHDKSSLVVDAFDQEQWDASGERENGGALWPALFSGGFHSSGAGGHAMSSFAVDTPPWSRDPACSTKPGPLECLSPIKKVLRDPNNKEKSWKRCTNHVYITHLIQELQVPKLHGIQHIGSSQSCPSEDLAHGFFKKSNPLDADRIGLNAILLPFPLVGSADQKNHNEVRNSLLTCKSRHLDQKQATCVLDFPASKNQGNDFLSLSTGSGGPGAKKDAGVAGNGFELLKPAAPYLHSLPRLGPVDPFTCFQDRHLTSSQRDKNPTPAAPPPAQVLQFPSYLGSQIRHLHVSSSLSTKQLQVEHSQQDIWMAQATAAPCGSGTLTMSNIVHWPGTGHGPHPTMQFMQTFLSPPQSYVGEDGVKHLVMSKERAAGATEAHSSCFNVAQHQGKDCGQSTQFHWLSERRQILPREFDGSTITS